MGAEGPPGAAAPRPAQRPLQSPLPRDRRFLPPAAPPAAPKIVADVSCLEFLLLLAGLLLALVHGHSLLPLLNDPISPLPRVTELAQRVTGRRVPEPGQRVLALEFGCEGEEDGTTFPPLHYELGPGSSPCTPVGPCAGPTVGAQ